MTKRTSTPNGPFDESLGTTPLELTIEARLKGSDSQIPLDLEEQQLVEDMVPWLKILQNASVEVDSAPTFHSDSHSISEGVDSSDPVALMLGLVPNEGLAIEGFKLLEARKKLKLNLGEFLERLRLRDWDVSTKEGLRWENGQTSLPPALIAAICHELRVDQTDILARATQRSPFAELLDDDRIASFLRDWAIEANLKPIQVKERVTAALSGASRRNGTVGSVETLLEILQTLRGVPHFLDNQ